jgi:hypothetical protein
MWDVATAQPTFLLSGRARTAKTISDAFGLRSCVRNPSILDEAHGSPEAPIAVVHAHYARIEVEAPSVARTIGRGRPIDAVGAHAAHIAIAIAVARGGQKD